MHLHVQLNSRVASAKSDSFGRLTVALAHLQIPNSLETVLVGKRQECTMSPPQQKTPPLPAWANFVASAAAACTAEVCVPRNAPASSTL